MKVYSGKQQEQVVYKFASRIKSKDVVLYLYDLDQKFRFQPSLSRPNKWGWKG